MSKLSCYLRTHRRKWDLSQKELSALMPRASRNRVLDVESGRRLPNAEEILAYSLIFGSSARELFPAYVDEVEEAVVRRAFTWLERLEKEGAPSSARLIDFLEDILTRATAAVRAREV